MTHIPLVIAANTTGEFLFGILTRFSTSMFDFEDHELYPCLYHQILLKNIFAASCRSRSSLLLSQIYDLFWALNLTSEYCRCERSGGSSRIWIFLQHQFCLPKIAHLVNYIITINFIKRKVRFSPMQSLIIN